MTLDWFALLGVGIFGITVVTSIGIVSFMAQYGAETRRRNPNTNRW